MKNKHTTLAGLTLIAGSLFSAAAFAQSADTMLQRDVNEQQRIEQGLQSGQLTTREAGRLESEAGRVDKMEARALKDGRVTDAERQRINQAQNRLSNDIYREKHDARTGNPNSPSSQRLQADVQRNINQQRRIEQGVRSGQLTGHEAGRLERQQARTDRMEARAGRDGHLGPNEQRHIQMAENRDSRQIRHERHDRQMRR